MKKKMKNVHDEKLMRSKARAPDNCIQTSNEHAAIPNNMTLAVKKMLADDGVRMRAS